jgi:WD40 repeat protein
MTSEWKAQVVGVNYYIDNTSLENLTVAVNDAEAIAAQLEKFGYQSFRVKKLPSQLSQKGEQHISPDGVVKRQELETAIANLLTPPDNNPPETALFFFSGHGWRKTVNGKAEVFLATSDVYENNEDYEYGVAVSWLGKLIKESQVKRVIVWLDCCFSGELINYLSEDLPENKDFCIFTATRSYEQGIEIKHQLGLFTKSLLEGLNPSKHPDGIVDSHKLAKYIKEEMAQTEQAPQCFNSENPILLTKTLNKCPYRSLSYFTEKEEDAEVFYGREKLTLDLVERVRNEERLIAVFGKSGSGKSSLIRAGLLYQLELGQAIPGSNNWIYLEPFAPTNAPLVRLREVVTKSKELAPIFRKFKKNQILNQDGQKNKISAQELSFFLKEIKEDQTLIILIVDQFEECFTMENEETRTEFITFLTELIQTLPNFYLIFGMRSDFRGRLREFPEFSQAIMAKINVEHLNREEIQEAIEKPAQFVGLGIDDGLKQQLINDVEDYPESLPLLQYTLTKLWDEAREHGEKSLRLKTYEKLGGIEGTLQKSADAVYESLSEEEKTVAKRIFLELTQVGDNYDTRRRVRLEDLANSQHSFELLDTVTQKLASDKNRLITRTAIDEEISQLSDNSLQAEIRSPLPPLKRGENAKSKIIIDVVHEALIRHWKLLGDWKQEYQNGMVIERRIEELAQEWDKRGRKNDELYPASKLGIVEGYLKDFGEWGMLDGMAEEFITESRKREEELITESRKRKQVVRRNGVIVVTTVVLILLAASVISVMFGLDAKHQKTIAQNEKNNAQEKTKIAQEEKDKAELATKRAINSEKEAREKADLAEQQRKKAVQEKQRADKNADKAQKQTDLAESSRIEAENAKQQAEDNLKLAQVNEEKAKKNADEARRKTVEAQRQTSIANNRLKNTIGVLIKNSQELFDSNTGKEFDALLTSLKAARLQQSAVEKSPDTKLLKEALQNAVLSVKERNRLEGHKAAVNSVSFSPDGRLLASSSTDGTIKLWNITTGKVIKTLGGNNIKVGSVSFSKDGRLASGSADGTIKLWNVTTGKVIKILDRNKFEVNNLSFSPDGQLLASGNVDGTIKFWDLTTGEPKMAPNKTVGWGCPNKFSFSSDGRLLAFIGQDQTIKLWDVTTDDKITSVGSGAIDSISFSKDGQWLAYSDGNRTIHVWDVAKEKMIYDLTGHTDGVWSLSFSPNGQILASGGGAADKTIKLWDLATGEEIKTLTGHKLGVNKVSFSANGNLLASASNDGTIKLWDIVPHNVPHKEVIPLNSDNVNGVGDGISLSPDGKLLASTTKYNPMIKLWDVATHKEIAILTGHEHWLRSVSFSPDGNLLASAAWDGTIRLWDVRACIKATTCEASRIYPKNGNLASVSFSRDGKLLASTVWVGTTDYIITLWDIRACSIKDITHEASQTCLYQRMSKKGHSGAASFSRDGKLLASGGADKTIKIWDVAKGKEIKTLTGHSDELRGVSFSPDGKLLASASNDQTIKLWDVATGKEIKTLTGHTGPVIRVIFGPDGKWLVSGSDDKTIKLWDVATGKAINTIKGHRDAIVNFSLSKDGQLLASNSQTWGDSKGEIILWNLKILSNLTLDNLIGKGCDWVRGYLENNPNVTESDRHLCDGKPKKPNAKNG